MKEVFYHGSPICVEKLDMQTAQMGGAKIKFGYGVCVTPVYEMAVKDSDVANEANMHYVYTVEVPAKTETNYLGYKEPVHPAIVAAVEDQTVEGYAVQKHPKFEIYADKAGEYRFRLKATNGQVIATSEGYKAKESCLNGIASVQKNAPEAEVVAE